MAYNKRIHQLNHSTYECEYHIVWATRYRQKYFEKEWLKSELKRILILICKWKKFRIISWHIGDEHVHLYISISPKYSVSYAVEMLKGKSSNWIKKTSSQLPKGSIWARGYYVSTVGLNEVAIKKYIESHGERPKDVQLELIDKKAGV